MPRKTAKPPAFDATMLRLLWEIPRFWRAAMDRRLKPLGLSEAKWRTVLHLSRGPADMSQTELASRLSVEAPTLARLLDRLASDGWIERRAAANDRRIKTVHLLPKAAGVIREIDRTMQDTQRDVLRGLSTSELRACVATLDKIRNRAAHAAQTTPVATRSKHGR
jgi:MarR family transcriptional regulator, transcriptional regulator for hemolysin